MKFALLWFVASLAVALILVNVDSVKEDKKEASKFILSAIAGLVIACCYFLPAS